MNSCDNVDVVGFQFSLASPLHVPKSDKQTFPQLYRFGLNLTPPWFSKCICGLTLGHLSGMYASKMNTPLSYGVLFGPVIITRIHLEFIESTRANTDDP